MDDHCTREAYQEGGDVGIFPPCEYCKQKEESTSQSS